MIHFVGAGSGAVDLITVRGQKLLEEADIVVYAGSLVNPELLKNCQKDCQIYNSAKMTLEEVDRSAFERAADTILSARTIYIVGIRSCAPLASFLAFYFHMIFPDVRQVQTNSSSEIFEQMIRITEDDVVIGISFPRYSKKAVKALKYASDRGATVVAITDSTLSPLTKYAEHVLLAKSDMVSFVDSLVGPLALINALIVTVAIKKKDEVANTLLNLETIWDEYGVYEKVEDKTDEERNV